MEVKSESEVAQSCPTLCDPVDCSPPGFTAHGIFQARVLEWGAIAFSDQEPNQHQFNPHNSFCPTAPGMELNHYKDRQEELAYRAGQRAREAKQQALVSPHGSPRWISSKSSQEALTDHGKQRQEATLEL